MNYLVGTQLRTRNSSSPHSSEHVILPIGIATSNSYLKLLEKKLLLGHSLTPKPYLDMNDNMRTKVLSQGDRGLAYEIPHLPDIETINSRISDGNHFSENLHHKNPFAAGLTEQIEGKKLEKLKMKNEELQQERFLLRHQQTLDSLEKYKYDIFKKRVAEYLKIHNTILYQKRLDEKLRMSSEKAFYRTLFGDRDHQSLKKKYPRYRKDNDITKSYVYELEQASRQRNKILMSNGSTLLKGMDTVNPYTPNALGRSSSKLNMISYHHGSETIAREKEQKMKNDLKQALLQQIEQKYAKNKQSRKEYQMWHQSQPYSGVHHPICNPIDLKWCKDNYIILRYLQSSKSN